MEQTRRAVQGVVEAVKPLGEEHVARHLASYRCVGLVHLLLDQRVASLPHHRYTTSFLDRLGKCLRCFDVEDDRLTLARARQDLARVDDKQIVTPDNLASIVDHANAIGVAIEGDANVGTIFLYRGDQILKVFWNCRIRVMIGKGSVALAEKVAWLDTESCEKPRHDERSCSVAAIENGLEIARQLADTTSDVVDVAIDDWLAVQTPLPARELSCNRQIVDVLNVGAVDGIGRQPKLEPIVLWRVVGPGDLDAADNVEIVLRPIRQWRGNDPDIDDLDAAGEQSRYERLVEPDPTRPIVAADRDRSVDAFFGEKGSVRATDRGGDVLSEVFAGNPAYVVLAKDFTRELHVDQCACSAMCPPAGVRGCVFTAGSLRWVNETIASGNIPKIRMMAADAQTTARVHPRGGAGRT